MKQQSKFSAEQNSETEHQAQSQQQREFASPEELLRFDAAQTSVPSAVAERLQRSTETISPPPNPSWWRRFFGGTNS
ncbi:MAG TPA: hypothetical protein VFM25_10885 [Verrucomicrobiae bacterium]|nr:hypothetical protein [Verrucomicrobiae bacterium]